MRIRRHFPPPTEWRGLVARLHLPPLPDRRRLRTFGLWLLGAVVAGYLTTLAIFPAPILPGRTEVPPLLGVAVTEARDELERRGLRAVTGPEETHASAPAGTVIWQDPPAGVRAAEGTEVTLVASVGAAKIPVPDVIGYEGDLAQDFIRAAGLTVSRVESTQAPAPRGVTVVTRPPAPGLLSPGGGVIVVVSQGAPTITVPDLLGLQTQDARDRLEVEGLQLGTVERRRTPDATPGSVIVQRPAAGTLASPGTVIDIVIARSP
jgi:serine/threonine-protein kinase